METKKCAYCGEEFTPTGRNAKRQKYCLRDHYAVCQTCGTLFLIKDISNGVPKCCSKQCSNKLKVASMNATVKKTYGVDNISQDAENKKKAGAAIAAKSEQITQKRKATLLRTRGVEHAMQCDEIKEKAKQTNISTYGVDNPSKSESIKKKISDKLKSPEVRAKYEATSMSHYGVPHPAQSEEVQAQMQATNEKVYGYPYAIQHPDVKAQMAQSISQSYKDDPSKGQWLAQQIHIGCKTKHGVDWPCQLPQCSEATFKQMSRINNQFAKLLEDNGFVIRRELPIENRKFDFLLTESNIIIEVDPSYTHNAHGSHFEGNQIGQYVHLNKTLLAEKYGYRCIHLFDWDDKYKVLNMLKSKATLYARKCEIHKIDSKTASTFLDSYHLQGRCKGQKYCYGLYHEGQLVSVMTFGKPRYNRNYEWELLRLCTSSDYRIIGGASKMMEAFIEEVTPKSILSYCDLAKFTGSVYINLGFQHVRNTPPQVVWSKGARNITANHLRKHGYDQLFGTNFGKGTSNEELMLNDGWLPVYDCGQAVYVWLSR